jgi:hypothetical protein
MLRAAIRAALAGEGGFRLVAQGVVVAPAVPGGLDGHAGCPVLWPMENS